MLCNKCDRQIAEDSIFCSYCGAVQPQTTPAPAQTQNTDTDEPAKPRSFISKLIGWLVAAALLAALALIVYALSSSGAPILSDWGTVME